MTEYLIRLLKDKFPIATLSRGYKRRTTGFLLADKNSTSHQVGDEPLQFKKKFPELIVAVDENRKDGIKKLLSQFPELKVALLDDAFQHRRVKPGLSILLADYNKMFYDDFLLPVGSLREWASGKKRADIIIATKCPANLSPVEKRIVQKKISPDPHQQVLFSHIQYGNLVPVFPQLSSSSNEEMKTSSVILLTGISNPQPLQDYLKDKVGNIIPMHYPDHHEYTFVEATKVAETFNGIASQNKLIITTEKDAMRLDKPGLVEILHTLPMYYIPIEITFDEKEKSEFNQLINDYVFRTNQKHRGVH
jgi:tetraacyldisaccharide 4'-kinase